MNKASVFICIICFSLIGILNSCKKTTSCLTPQFVTLNFSTFKLNDTGKVIDSILPKVNFYLADTPIYFLQEKENVKNFSALLSPEKTIQKFYLNPNTDDIILDTIFLQYSSNLNFISNSCGYQHFYNLEKVWSSQFNIDSIWLNEKLVNNEINKTHIHILF
ncbi:MAG: hypothetical protein KA275_02975 [Chitinophagaceae bacterium]|nr:hypothetical protein [Chitinophagaceae bacterium]